MFCNTCYSLKRKVALANASLHVKFNTFPLLINFVKLFPTEQRLSTCLRTSEQWLATDLTGCLPQECAILACCFSQIIFEVHTCRWVRNPQRRNKCCVMSADGREEKPHSSYIHVLVCPASVRARSIVSPSNWACSTTSSGRQKTSKLRTTGLEAFLFNKLIHPPQDRKKIRRAERAGF